MESAKLFVERMKNDEDFRNRVNGCKDNETRKAFVSEQGFDFTGEDIELVKAELSDEDLTGLAGAGAVYCWTGTAGCLTDPGFIPQNKLKKCKIYRVNFTLFCLFFLTKSPQNSPSISRSIT